MNILVIGGMHGNEPLGIEVVQRLNAAPRPNIDTVLGNELAIKQSSRYVKFDLNRSFPGDKNSQDYEPRRADSLLQLTRRYDVVLDFHNTHCPDNDCGFIGESAPSSLADIAAWLGLNRVIVADYDCINKYAPNCLSVEISLTSSKMNAKRWVDNIISLSQLPSVPPAAVQKYRFVYRMTLKDKQKYNLDKQSLAAFKKIKPELALAMGVKTPAYPIFIADNYTPYNYGGLLNTLQ